MKAAVVNSFEQPPSFATFEDPVAGEGEVLVRMAASALSNLVKGQVAGRHYSSKAIFPFVAGVDGVGRLADGRRTYFAFPRAPFGSLAQTVPVRPELCAPVPDDVDDVTAAAMANPGMSSWAALTARAKFVRGEAVLVNGATGVSGRLAVQIAKHLGARTVIATGRNAQTLEMLPGLGADAVISLAEPGPNLIETFRRTLRAQKIDVILDYLWGASAEALMAAVAGDGSVRDAPRIRFVQIGASSAPTLTLAGGTLRSSGLELLGSGIGSVSPVALVDIIKDVLQAVGPAKLQIDVESRPLETVEAAWDADTGSRRLVFTF